MFLAPLAKQYMKMKKIVSVLLSIGLSSSFAQSHFQVHGHRGARGLAPENTIPAFYEGAKSGADFLELDVVITKDMKVLVSHEPWLRSAICENVKSSKPKDYNIFNMTVAEVQSYDCGSKFNPDFPEQQKRNVPKPLLSEVIDSIRNYCEVNKLKLPKLNVEIKCWKSKDGVFQPDPKTFVQLVYGVLKEKDFLHNVIVQSFDLRVLQELRAMDKAIPQELLIANLKSVKQNVKALGYTPTSYSPYFKLVNKKVIESCHEMGMTIVPWTVNSLEKIQELKALGVDGVITDYPNLLAEPLKK